MAVIEAKQDLFAVDEKYHLAICISSDCSLNSGMPLRIQETYRIRSHLRKIPPERRIPPACIHVGRTLNIITKQFFWQKPSCDMLADALLNLRNLCEHKGIHYVAIPQIAAVEDGLEWDQVRTLVQGVFEPSVVEVLLCQHQ